MTSSPSIPPTWPVLAVLASAMLLPSMGTSIVNVALPEMARAFGVAFPAVQWVVLSYLLALSAFIVGAGRLGDLFGRRRLLLAGLALFAVASMLGAVAGALWQVIAARALQGLGAAFMTALSIALVGDLVPKSRAGSAMGLLGTVSAVGTALGPTLGGTLVAGFGWPAVFTTLAGTGVASWAAARLILPADRPADRQTGRPPHFNPAGLVLLALALTASALVMTQAMGGIAANLALTAGALFAFLLLVRVEARAPSPLVQPRLLADPTLAAGLAGSGLIAAVLMSTLVVGPFYLSQALGLDALQTGLVMSVGPAVSALCGIPAGRAVDRFGPQTMTRFGLALLFLGTVLMVVLPIRLGWPGYAFSLAVTTSGYAVFQAANNTAIMARAAGGERGTVSGLLGLSRNLGLIAGASALGALFHWGTGITVPLFGAGAAAGLQVTFATAALLTLFAVALTRTGQTPADQGAGLAQASPDRPQPPKRSI